MMVNLTPAETQALEELREHLRVAYGPRLREVAVFGSRARGEAHEFSDVDVLVVVDDLSHAEGKAIAQFCGDLLTRHDVLVSTFSVSSERMQTLRRRERLIAREIERDGVFLDRREPPAEPA